MIRPFHGRSPGPRPVQGGHNFANYAMQNYLKTITVKEESV